MGWGSHSWGVGTWGGTFPYAYQGEKGGAKQDTRYTATSQTADRSQYDTDLTASGSYAAYEAASARAALTGEWTIEHRAEYDYSAHRDEVLVTHGDDAGTSYTYRMMCSNGGGGGIACAYNGVLITTLNVASGVVDRSISWAMRANPDTTGAGDAMISEFCAWDHDAGGWELDHQQVEHAAPTSDVAYNLSVHGQWDDGGSTMNAILALDVTRVRISEAFHSHVEFAEDFVANRSWTASTVDEHSQPLMPTKSSGMGDEGELVGAPQLGALCEHQKHAICRSFSPLVNEVYNVQADWNVNYTPANFMRRLPQDIGLRMPLSYLRWVAVPENASHIWARVHVKTAVSSGSACPAKIAIISMSIPPSMQLNKLDAEAEPPAHFAYWGHSTIEVDHTGTNGAWVDLGKIKIARCTREKAGWSGTTFIALGYEVDPESTSSNDYNLTININAIQVWPLSEVPGDGGLNDELPVLDG